MVRGGDVLLDSDMFTAYVHPQVAPLEVQAALRAGNGVSFAPLGLRVLVGQRSLLLLLQDRREVVLD